MFKDIKAFLSSFFKKTKKQHLFRKYLGITLVGILAILIPATIIFCYLNFKEDAPIPTAPDVSLTVFDNDGHTIHSETINSNDIESSPFVKTVYGVLNSKIATEKPTDFKKDPTFNITVTSDSNTSTFKCYFDKNASSSFIEDTNGNFFLPNADAYVTFLNSPFSQSVYPESTPPALSIGDSTSITPHEVDWTYTLIGGTTQVSQGNETTEDVKSYMIDGLVKFTFSSEPDECTVKIFDKNEELVFEGTNKSISDFTANEGDEFNVSLHAKWDSKEDALAYGEQNYNFNIICTKPSEIKLSASTASGGDFIIVSVSNANSADAIIYTPKYPVAPKDVTEPQQKALETLYDYAPIFTISGHDAYALIPIPYDVPVSSFEFSIAYGISKADFSLVLTERIVTTTIPLPEKDVSFNVDSAKDEFETILSETCTDFEDLLLFTSEFLSPEEYGFKKVLDSSNDINISEEESFKFLATSFVSESEQVLAVKSANVGKVRAVGRSVLLGNYVVIDHGAGLYTWYCGLSEIGVSKGTVLKKGDFIGRSGSTSPLCENGVNIFCTLYENLIDPTDVLGQKLI